MSDLVYINTGGWHVVLLDGQRIGRVRKLGMYWHAYGVDGTLIPGTFGSMSAAGERVAEHEGPPSTRRG